MNFEDIYKLWDRFESSSLSEMEIDTEGTHLRLKKPECGQVIAAPVASVVAEPVKAAVKAEPVAAKSIKAPLVGTFYTAPSPDSAPFVTIGSEVKKGDVIGIIEAMKLMNEVTATEDGIVSEVLVADGSFVEFDQVLINLK